MKFHLKMFIKKMLFTSFFLLIVLNSLWIIPNLLFNKGFSIQNSIGAILTVVVFELIMIIALLYGPFKDVLAWKKIEHDGKRLNGRVKSAYYDVMNSTTEKRYSELYFVIQYNDPDTNKEESFITIAPFSPLKLSSKDCIVYKYKNGRYVTDYKCEKSSNKESIWTEKEINNFRKYGHLDENYYE